MPADITVETHETNMNHLVDLAEIQYDCLGEHGLDHRAIGYTLAQPLQGRWEQIIGYTYKARGSIVGHAIVADAMYHKELVTLVIDPEWQRQRIGTMAVQNIWAELCEDHRAMTFRMPLDWPVMAKNVASVFLDNLGFGIAKGRMVPGRLLWVRSK